MFALAVTVAASTREDSPASLQPGEVHLGIAAHDAAALPVAISLEQQRALMESAEPGVQDAASVDSCDAARLAGRIETRGSEYNAWCFQLRQDKLPAGKVGCPHPLALHGVVCPCHVTGV